MSVYKMSTTQMLKFVDLYRDAYCLWDSNSEWYRDREIRHNALKSIADEMDIEGFGPREVAQKVKNIRSTYYQEVKKIVNSQMSGKTVYKPKVPWFVVFDSFMNKSSAWSTSNTEKKEETNQESGSETEQQCFTRTKPEQDPLHIQPRKKQKHKNRSPSRYITNAIAKIEKLATRRETEFDVWAKSVAIQLNNMNSCRALRLQLQLQSVITEERLAHECEQDD